MKQLERSVEMEIQSHDIAWNYALNRKTLAFYVIEKKTITICFYLPEIPVINYH